MPARWSRRPTGCRATTGPRASTSRPVPGAGTADGGEISLADFAGLIEAATGLEGGVAGRRRPGRRRGPVFSDEEQREVEERLRGLGYLE